MYHDGALNRIQARGHRIVGMVRHLANRRTSRTILAVAVHTLWGSAAIAGPQATTEMVCAVIPGTGSDIEKNVADALERPLSAVNGVRLVNRAELKAVLTEQLLSAAMAAEGISSRLQLGRMVKADVLILLRERKVKTDEDEQVILDLVVAETRRGLRLGWSYGRSPGRICGQRGKRSCARRSRHTSSVPGSVTPSPLPRNTICK